MILEENGVAGGVVTPEAEARRLVGDAAAGLIVFGSIHGASAGTVAGRRLVAIGAVGFPMDGDPLAPCALVRWEEGAWEVEHRRVATTTGWRRTTGWGWGCRGAR